MARFLNVYSQPTTIISTKAVGEEKEGLTILRVVTHDYFSPKKSFLRDTIIDHDILPYKIKIWKTTRSQNTDSV